MTDDDLIALCAFQEANLEPDDGLAAVVRVVLNRQRLGYQSDGSVAGTIFHGDGTAFSWAAFEMVEGRYQRVAAGPAAIAARAERLLIEARGFHAAWARTQRITGQVRGGVYAGADFAQVTGDTLLYLNPAICNAAWASPDKFVCRIGRHSFFRA